MSSERKVFTNYPGGAKEGVLAAWVGVLYDVWWSPHFAVGSAVGHMGWSIRCDLTLWDCKAHDQPRVLTQQSDAL